MSQPEAETSFDRQLLSELYREHRIGWQKLLTKLDLPTDAGIVRTMTLGEAKALAARRVTKPTREHQAVSGTTASPPKEPIPAHTQAPNVDTPGLSPLDLGSITAAIREEIAAAQETVRTAWLDIDGIEHPTDVPGNFVYRLILSSPTHFSPDQTVTFHTRNPKDTIQAVIVRSDDEGLVVECQRPLPTDAKLLSLSFDRTSYCVRWRSSSWRWPLLLEPSPDSSSAKRFLQPQLGFEAGPRGARNRRRNLLTPTLKIS